MQTKSVIGIVSDHAAFSLKADILSSFSFVTFNDLGCYSEESVDFPIYSEKLADFLAESESNRGVAICGTGIGIGVGVNKKNISCVLCTSVEDAEYAKNTLKSQAISIGARITGKELALDIVNAFLT